MLTPLDYPPYGQYAVDGDVRLSPEQIEFAASLARSSLDLPAAMLFHRASAQTADFLSVKIDTSSLDNAPDTVASITVAITDREYNRGLVTDGFIANKIKNMLYRANREIRHYMSLTNANAA